MRFHKISLPVHTRAYWLLLGFLILLGLVASGAREDLMSLPVVRPVAVLLTFYGLWGLTREQFAANRGLFLFLLATFLLILLYLVPLPPSIWQALPGRELIAQIDRGAGLGEVWRPASLSPGATRNALFAMFVPIAAALLLAQVDREERYSLLTPVLVFGVISMMLAMLQYAAPSARGLWFYRITNEGLPVGLFSNRNHGAVFHAALLPLLAVWSQLPVKNRVWAKLRPAIAIAIGLVILPLVMASGSRAGLVIAVVALVSVPFLLPKRPVAPRPPRHGPFGWIEKRHVLYAGAVILVAIVVANSFLGSQEGALQRLSVVNDREQRLVFWAISAPLIGKYFPFGSGAGTFVEALKIDEPVEALAPNYINHAHNDVLEVAMTTGAAGIVLMLIAALWLLYRAWRAWRSMPREGRDRAFARMASVMIALFVAASIVDYPLRVPSIAAFAVLLVFWLKPGEAPGPEQQRH